MPKPSSENSKVARSRTKLEKQSLDACLALIRNQYLADSRPWVIGYSGGKDSTCVLQLTWQALKGLPKASLVKPIYVIASDTMVESPAVEKHLSRSLKQISDAASVSGFPITAHKVTPTIDHSFWVNLIGRGYPAPYSNFRWCTDRMKIEPTTAFVHEKVAQYGEVVILLGGRKSESSTRAQVMTQRREIGTQLSRHNSVANAWVLTPIEDWSEQDVWTYLTNMPSPWGADNRELITMYRNAQAGECPLVIDKTTPSCGGGRFGCWVCTVVERDKTMEAMVDNGEDWLQPLLEFRNWLAATKDPSKKKEIREIRRRTGRIEFFTSGSDSKLKFGPFKMTFRREILERLLLTQKLVRESGPDPKIQLIRDEELYRIRQMWLHEEGDWEDSLPAIYEKITGTRLDWLEDDWSGMRGAEKKILEDVTAESGLPAGLLVELMDAERDFHGMSRRSGIYDELDRTLRKDWRTWEQAHADDKLKNESATGE